MFKTMFKTMSITVFETMLKNAFATMFEKLKKIAKKKKREFIVSEFLKTRQNIR